MMTHPEMWKHYKELIEDINRNAEIMNEATSIKPTDEHDAMAQVLGVLAYSIAVTIGRVGLAITEAIQNHES